MKVKFNVCCLYSLTRCKIDIKITKIENGPFSENAWIVADLNTHECVLIDPGDDADKIAASINRQKLNLKCVLATHGHLDHIGAVDELASTYHVPFRIHSKDESLVQGLTQYQRMFGLPESKVPTISGYISDRENFTCGQIDIEVIETPGHTLGGVCFKIGHHLFAGDTLFHGSVGRTDLPGGDQTSLISSIKSKLLVLPENTVVHCGHGPDTTIGNEQRNNPFLKQ